MGKNPVEDFDEMGRWLKPLDLLSLLTLATGSEVGAPWIELRDGTGQLMRRIHRPLRETRYFRGHRVIEERPYPEEGGLPMGTGRLLTKAVSESDKFGEPFLRVAIMHLARSKYEHQTIDESLTSLCRALDSLCIRYKVARRILRESLSDLEQREAVSKAWGEARKKIESLAKEATRAGDLDSRRILTTIASRVNNADNVDRSFGPAVADLLREFDLPDADIVESYFAAKAGAGLRCASILCYVGRRTRRGRITSSFL